MPLARSSILVLLLSGLVGCSGTASEPEVFDSGELVWGARPDQQIEWQLEEAFGYQDAVVLAVTSGSDQRSGQVGRVMPDDLLWWAGLVPFPDAPTLVFGGASNEVSSVVIFVDGEQIEIELIPVAGRAWSVGVAELPAHWAADGVSGAVEIVGFKNGIEVQRVPMQGPSG